jgi:hypothetical protein
VALVTVPGITQIDTGEWAHTWYWSFTSHSMTRLFGEEFGPGNVTVEQHGSVLSAVAFLEGNGCRRADRSRAGGGRPRLSGVHRSPRCEGTGIVRSAGARRLRQRLRPARAHVRRLRRAAGPPVRNGSVALVYHRAAHDEVDPWRLAVAPAHLSEHLEILAKHTVPLHASALHSARKNGSIPRRTTVVTFDDGYADLATEIAPRLEQAGVPATMYVVSRAVDRDREFWWDALARALLGPDAGRGPLSLTIDGRTSTWDVVSTASRPVVHKDVWERIRSRPPKSATTSPSRSSSGPVYRSEPVPATAR